LWLNVDFYNDELVQISSDLLAEHNDTRYNSGSVVILPNKISNDKIYDIPSPVLKPKENFSNVIAEAEVEDKDNQYNKIDINTETNLNLTKNDLAVPEKTSQLEQEVNKIDENIKNSEVTAEVTAEVTTVASNSDITKDSEIILPQVIEDDKFIFYQMVTYQKVKKYYVNLQA
jgi:hypothetical protein